MTKLLLSLLLTTAVFAALSDISQQEKETQTVTIHINSAGQMKAVTWDITGLAPYKERCLEQQQCAFTQNSVADTMLAEFTKTLAEGKRLSSDKASIPMIMSKDCPYFTSSCGWLWRSIFTCGAIACPQDHVQMIFSGHERSERGFMGYFTLEGSRIYCEGGTTITI